MIRAAKDVTALSLPREPPEQIAPTLRARDPRLLVRRTKPRFRQTDRATSTRLGA